MIEYLIINSLVIFGAHAALKDGMIFGFVAKFVTRWVLKFFLWVYGDGSTCSYIETDVFGMQRVVPYSRDATEKAAASTSFITKPLFDCPPCMASVWGIPFVLLHPINIWSGVYLFALCGINYITMKLINR